MPPCNTALLTQLHSAMINWPPVHSDSNRWNGRLAHGQTGDSQTGVYWHRSLVGCTWQSRQDLCSPQTSPEPRAVPTLVHGHLRHDTVNITYDTSLYSTLHHLQHTNHITLITHNISLTSHAPLLLHQTQHIICITHSTSLKYITALKTSQITTPPSLQYML